MGLHIITLDEQWSHRGLNVSSIQMGDTDIVVQEIRIVVGAKSTRAEAECFLTESIRDQSGNIVAEYYGALTPGQSLSKLHSALGRYRHLGRFSLLCIGTSSGIDLALKEDNIGKPVSTLLVKIDVLRAMVALKKSILGYRGFTLNRSLSLAVSA